MGRLQSLRNVNRDNKSNSFDVTFDLWTGKFRTFRKASGDPQHIKHSSHPPSITKQQPNAINKQVAALLSDSRA